MTIKTHLGNGREEQERDKSVIILGVLKIANKSSLLFGSVWKPHRAQAGD